MIQTQSQNKEIKQIDNMVWDEVWYKFSDDEVWWKVADEVWVWSKVCDKVRRKLFK